MIVVEIYRTLFVQDPDIRWKLHRLSTVSPQKKAYSPAGRCKTKKNDNARNLRRRDERYVSFEVDHIYAERRSKTMTYTVPVISLKKPEKLAYSRLDIVFGKGCIPH